MKKITLPKIWPVACHTKNIGKNSTFVAIKGDNLDGAKFIDQAKAQGATKVVTQNARQALSNLSAAAWGYPAKKLKIIGVTGTKGKTTTVYALRHLLYKSGKKVAMITGVENMIGDQKFKANLTTPQPDYLHMFFAQCVDAGIEYVVMEVSAQALSLYRVDDIEFECAVFTNFEMEHSEFYSSIEEYFAAKCKLFNHLKTDGLIIVNNDDRYLRDNLLGDHVLRQAQHDRQNNIVEDCPAYFDTSAGLSMKAALSTCPLILSLSKNAYPDTSAGLSMKAALSIRSAHPELVEGYERKLITFGSSDNSDFKLVIKNSGLKLNFSLNNITYNLNVPGEFNAYNLSCAIICTQQIGLTDLQIQKALASFKTPPGRIETYYLSNGASGVVDYAHTPNSFKNILGLLRKQTNNLIVVFGAGGGKDHQKRPIMGQIAIDICDTVILTNDNPRHEDPNEIVKQIIGSNANDKIIVELDRSEAIKLAYSLSTLGDVIVVLGKGPDEYQIVGNEKFFFSDKNEILNL